jgi:hypothetical protein
VLKKVHEATTRQQFQISENSLELAGVKLAKELYTCASLVVTNKYQKEVGSDTQITFDQTKKLMEMMGYLTRSFGVLP